MNIVCPVCFRSMNNTTDGLWLCPPRKTFFPKLNVTLELSHCNMLVTWAGKRTFLSIVSGEFSFRIFDDDQKQQTIIKQLRFIEKSPWQIKHSKVKEHKWVDIMEINGAIDLPWHDAKQVAERLKTYIIFS